MPHLGFVPARTLGREYFRYEEGMHAMVGNSSGETHRLGDRVTVKLVEAAPVAGALFVVLGGKFLARRKTAVAAARASTEAAEGKQIHAG